MARQVEACNQPSLVTDQWLSTLRYLNTGNPVVDAAIYYASVHKLPIYPLWPDRQVPRMRGFQAKATRDPAQIREWVRKWPDMRIATLSGPASGIVLLDLDSKKGKDGPGELRKLVAVHGALPMAPATCTPSGGMHLYFKAPKGVSIRSRAGDIAPGIDVRGGHADGSHSGVIPLPPSPGVKGGRYEWWTGQLAFADLPEPPPWLLFMMIFKADQRERLADLGITGPESFCGLEASNWEFIGRGLLDDATRKAFGLTPGQPMRADIAGQLLPYVEASIAGELGKIEAATEGKRDAAVNDAAMKIWSLLKGIDPFGGPPGELVQETRERFLNAASALGTDQDGTPFIGIAAEKWDRTQFDADPRDLSHVAAGKATADGVFGDMYERELSAVVSHDKLALRFSERHADDLRYVAAWGRWLLWDGCRWSPDGTREALDRVREVVREEAARHAKPQVANQIESRITVAAVEYLATADRAHAETADAWDTDRWLLGTPDGTVDLRTGELRQARREDMITKATAVGPRGECPLWLDFLDQIFSGDRELIAYMQRLLGYSLTGNVTEHVLAFCYGLGGNGKGTLLNTWSGIMGDYAATAPKGMLEEARHERHPTEIARLRGARLVVAQETERGSRWAETTVKTLTGGDRLTGRFMRGDFFEFDPQFTLIVAGNHKPSLRDVTEAMKRRMHLILFAVHFADGVNRVLGMEERLKTEWPGILRWAVHGCLMWQREGLGRPKAVRDATAAYFSEQDVIDGFLVECCDLSDTGSSEEVGNLFSRFTMWVAGKGKTPLSQKEFSTRLQSRLVHQLHPQNRRAMFRGVKLFQLPGFFG